MRSNLHRLTSLFACLTLSEPCFAASASLIVSDEVSGNNATGRALSDSLDDIWSSAYPTEPFGLIYSLRGLVILAVSLSQIR